MSRPTTVLESSRREALFVAVVWLAACAYTVGYAALFAYRAEAEPALIAGMPAWVAWGILAPWAVCTALTCWFAFWGMRDADLGEEETVESAAAPELERTRKGAAGA
jgi:hypothetical protein